MSSMSVANYRRFFVAQCLSSVGAWFRTLAIALVALELHGTASSLGILVALQWVPLLVLGSHAGTLIDRRPPRAILIATNAASAGVALGITIVSAVGHLGGGWLAIAALSFGCVLPFDRATALVLPVELVPTDQVPNALTLGTMVQSLARLVGPALGGIVLAGLGPTWCFAANAVTYLVAALVLLGLDTAAMHPRARTAAAGRHVRAGIAYVMSDRRLRAIVLVNAWIGLIALNFLVVITAIVELDFGGGQRTVGIAHSVNAAGALVAGAVVGAWVGRLSRRLDLVCIVLGLALAANAVAPSLAVFLALGPALGAALIVYQSTLLDCCFEIAEPDMFGRVSSILMMGRMGTTPLGALLVGVVIDAWSGRAALGLGAVACALGGLALAHAGVADPARGDDPTVDELAFARTATLAERARHHRSNGSDHVFEYLTSDSSSSGGSTR